MKKNIMNVIRWFIETCFLFFTGWILIFVISSFFIKIGGIIPLKFPYNLIYLTVFIICLLLIGSLFCIVVNGEHIDNTRNIKISLTYLKKLMVQIITVIILYLISELHSFQQLQMDVLVNLTSPKIYFEKALYNLEISPSTVIYLSVMGLGFVITKLLFDKQIEAIKH